MENKFFFPLLTWEPVEKNVTPSFFSNFLRNPPECLVKNKEFLKGSIWDVLMVESLLGVDPTQSYGENAKNLIQDFIDFAMKTN